MDHADPYLWLENIDSDAALNWARQRNDSALAQLCTKRFEDFRTQALEVMDTDARIPYVARRGEYLYNFWRHATNPRGLWRRTTLDSYRSDNPEWEVLLDIDVLARADGENWVWAGADVIDPEYTVAMVNLSRGGSDAVVAREFDMRTCEFVEGGFELAEAKSSVAWEDDEDTLIVCTDFGEGSMTDSGYPRIAKRWRRGQPLDDAETLYTAEPDDVRVIAVVDRTPGFEQIRLGRYVDFYHRLRYELRGDELILLDVPTDAGISVHRGWLLVEPRTDWTLDERTHPAGSLLAIDYEQFLSGARDFAVVFQPDAHSCLHHYAWTRDRLVVVTLRDVASHVEIVTPGTWQAEPARDIPDAASTVIAAIDEYGDEIFYDTSGFIEPSRLLYGTAGGPLEQIKAA